MNEKQVAALSSAAMLATAVGLGLVWRAQQADSRGESTATGRQRDDRWTSLDVEAFAAAELRIEHLRKQSDVDWRAIRAEYGKTLPVVRVVDRQRGLHYERDIAAALDKCAQGQRPKVNQQVIAKGLQHVAVLGIRRELSLLSSGETPKKTHGVARIGTFARGIRPTFVRRDKDYFTDQPTLAPELDDAVGGLRSAVSNEQPIFGESRTLMDTIGRTYALSVLYEVEQIEKLRDSDPEACEVKRMEAVIFYRIIADRIAKRNARAHAAIRTMLEAVPEQMNAGLLRSLLSSGLPGLNLP